MSLWRERVRWIRTRRMELGASLHSALNRIPLPTRLPFDMWWLGPNDHIGKPLRQGKFEAAEIAFVSKLLKTGMTVLDVGAHHGLYTLLASKRVGDAGKVIAFEPSSRERNVLRTNLKINRCRNVSVQAVALSDENTYSELYVVEAWAAGCNSLRPPEVPASSRQQRVRVSRLDDELKALDVVKADFVKLDVEGAELAVLRGARELLTRLPRPILLVEIQDIRTTPWGYRAKEIVKLVESVGYRWFNLSDRGNPVEAETSSESFDANMVAVPEELSTMLLRLSSDAVRSD